jgi:uncharacterized protein
VFVPVTDLVGSPGATRRLTRTIAVEEVGDDPWGPAEDALHDELHLDLVLDAVVEGVYVSGEVTWGLTMPCARCLRDVDLDRSVEVGELFADPRRLDPDDEVDEGYELVDGATGIDLERMLHDLVVLDLPTRPQCGREDCEVPVVDGVVFMTEDEARAAEEERIDPRWAALQGLDLSEN